VQNGAVTREQLRQVLSEQLGVPSVNLARFEYDARAVKAVSAELARKYRVMPLYRTDTRIAIGIENPLSWEALQELELFTGLKVDPAMAEHAELVAAIAQFYGAVAEIVAPPEVKVAAAMPAPFADGTFTIHVEAVPGAAPGVMRVRIDAIVGCTALPPAP
jgi:hypothetical protein